VNQDHHQLHQRVEALENRLASLETALVLIGLTQITVYGLITLVGEAPPQADPRFVAAVRTGYCPCWPSGWLCWRGASRTQRSSRRNRCSISFRGIRSPLRLATAMPRVKTSAASAWRSSFSSTRPRLAYRGLF
jgi:hypothetical protein